MNLQSIDKIVEAIQLKRIKELYLHWNKIKNEGGIQIFKELCEDKTLKVFIINLGF